MPVEKNRKFGAAGSAYQKNTLVSADKFYKFPKKGGVRRRNVAPQKKVLVRRRNVAPFKKKLGFDAHGRCLSKNKLGFDALRRVPVEKTGASARNWTPKRSLVSSSENGHFQPSQIWERKRRHSCGQTAINRVIEYLSPYSKAASTLAPLRRTKVGTRGF